MIASYYEGNKTFSVKSAIQVAPGPGEVRLDVAYCGICGTDIHIFHGAMDKRVDMPQTIGHEASATVAEIGEGVTGLAIGDSVVVRPLDNRGETTADRGISHICKDLKFIGIDAPGAFQNSWTVPAFTLHKLPANTDMKTAALAEPLAVACHDVRLGEVKQDELAVVLGGGPIGLLVALVSQAVGARVILSELNPFRLEFARSLGIETVDPREVDLVKLCQERSGGSGADIVFEVSGAKPAALSMTDLLAIRGRIVVVAIYPQPTEINLFQFFWKELQMKGARVYEPEDYEKAVQLVASGALPLDRMITHVETLENIQQAFDQLEHAGNAVKVLIDCRG
ncbi:zinc-dependent alcohol dehydrogenase [Cerasicoccus arenae]|uniref:Zn-dependent alcohol dehydrogenase n=1 Tax=Cerasicoccus arenae TaxID=424488 RepID=A0A8J3D9R5_9BACT|nr:zinc-binding dehydrogenase [Cerasicoccus arenae]MBK1857119.1 alcohol dehydrogenase catalytic domain-containing protein [Cerasicoccus arenae]GHB92478.1 Zn-dependent alcohol dehydrogenase [Cerasicoccus arenae]